MWAPNVGPWSKYNLVQAKDLVTKDHIIVANNHNGPGFFGIWYPPIKSHLLVKMNKDHQNCQEHANERNINKG